MMPRRTMTALCTHRMWRQSLNQWWCDNDPRLVAMYSPYMVDIFDASSSGMQSAVGNTGRPYQAILHTIMVRIMLLYARTLNVWVLISHAGISHAVLCKRTSSSLFVGSS
jgi:hypothetical protein